MSTTPGPRADAAPAPDLRRDAVTAALSVWLVAGLFVDGYMHIARPELESFWTPWHGVLYTGFLAAAAWICRPMLRLRDGRARLDRTALPHGYGLGALGAVVFAVGGVGDSVWHTVLGIEVGVEALISPPHLVLLAGGLLINTTPARAAWPHAHVAQRLSTFLPAVVSLTVASVAVGFFFAYGSGLYDVHATRWFVESFETTHADTPWLFDALTGHGVLARMTTTMILMVPTVLLVRRWRTPPGTFTVLFTAHAAFMLVLDQFHTPPMVLAGLAAGVAADVLVRSLRPSADRPWAARGFAALVPMVLWLGQVAVLAAMGDLGWSVVLWGGVALLGGGVGFALALLAFPPAGQPVAPAGAGASADLGAQ